MMRLIDIIPLTRIPHTQTQILSYFFSAPLAAGALVQIPLGKRKETGVVLDSHPVDEYKQEIKKADFELRHIAKVISSQPLLTPQQIELAVWLGQYYFASPGIFAKMMIPKKVQSSKFKVQNDNSKSKIKKLQKLILAPTVSSAEKIAKEYESVTLWHSELSKKQLNETWWRVKNGEVQTIIGTRSAVFLPFSNLKEIVIEDETNPAHRSWDMWPHYRVHEVAKKLTELFDAKLTLKSDMPSIESFFFFPRPKTKDYQLKTDIIDLRAELREGNFSIFSRVLQEAIKKTLTQKKQIILFINRRGAANFVLCRDCGYAVKCPNCDLPLAYHLVNQKPIMFCHRCGRQEEPPSLCPQCRSWRVKTVGVGTQKVELEAKKLFFQAKIARLDSDTAPNQKEQQKIIEAFAKKETDILITTQIIFSWLDEIASAAPALAAVISADTLLHLPDFRSGERTFQAITLLKNLLRPNGQFIIQTYNPEGSVIKYAAQSDWQSFYQEEIEVRQVLGYPPYSQIVKLTFRHRDPKKAGQEAKILAAKLTNVIASVPQMRDAKQSRSATATHGIASPRQSAARNDDFVIISDALPAFVPKEKGKYVWNIIIKFEVRSSKLAVSSEFLFRRNSLLQYVPSNWEIDVDPSDLL